MALSEPIEHWRRRGQTLRVHDLEIFVVDQGRGSAVLLLHGFPTSSWDWSAVLSTLSERHRVIAVDLPGFGLSAKPMVYSYSLIEQTDVLLDVCRAIDLRRAHVFGHDMGTTVATELLARREAGSLPFELASLTLMNGSVHIEMAHLTPSQKILRIPLLATIFTRLSTRRIFKLQFRRLFGRSDAVPDSELDRLWELLCHLDGHHRLPQTIRYIEERMANSGRWLPPLRRLDVPALVLWGRRDPVAVGAIADRLAQEIPTARAAWLDDVGHYPQLEDPARVATEFLAFIESVERTSAPATAAS